MRRVKYTIEIDQPDTEDHGSCIINALQSVEDDHYDPETITVGLVGPTYDLCLCGEPLVVGHVCDVDGLDVLRNMMRLT